MWGHGTHGGSEMKRSDNSTPRQNQQVQVLLLECSIQGLPPAGRIALSQKYPRRSKFEEPKTNAQKLFADDFLEGTKISRPQIHSSHKPWCNKINRIHKNSPDVRFSLNHRRPKLMEKISENLKTVDNTWWWWRTGELDIRQRRISLRVHPSTFDNARRNTSYTWNFIWKSRMKKNFAYSISGKRSTDSMQLNSTNLLNRTRTSSRTEFVRAEIQHCIWPRILLSLKHQSSILFLRTIR